MNSAAAAPARQVIQRLYDPLASPLQIQTAQEEIIALQKHQSGWALGEALLDQQDPHEQFIGALTFTVKIHDDKSCLPPNLAELLLSKLRQALHNNYAQFVVLKLFTTIIALYIRTFSTWDSFLVDIHSLLKDRLPLELTFFEELATTYTQGYTGSPQLRAALVTILPSILEIVGLGLQHAPAEALPTYSAWCLLFGSELEPLLPSAFEILASSDEDLFAKCCEVLAELYQANSRAWQKPRKNALIEKVLGSTAPLDESRRVPLGRLVLCIASIDILSPEMITDRLLPYISILTNNEAIEEDELLTEVLEFWSEFAEHVVSNGLSKQHNLIFLEVVQTYWRRIQLTPNLSEFVWEKLGAFRRDYCDFLELVYPLLGRELFAVFATNILSNIAGGDPEHYNWYEIEASLCCLCGLADIIDEAGPEYAFIEQVFASSLWPDLGACRIARVRHTAISVIGAYDSFFESSLAGPQTLARALTFLFTSLNAAPLQLTASRSIQKLCSSCRTSLTSEIYNFLQVYEPIRFKLEPVAHQRTVAAIGNIIEALDLEAQAEPLWRLLVLVENSEMEPVEVIKCIASIGKSIQKQKEGQTQEQVERAARFWDSEPRIRQNILEVVNEAFGMGPDIFEELCLVFKAGLSETVANPFTVSPGIILEFLKARKLQHNRVEDLPPILNLAGFLVSTRAAAKQLTPDILYGVAELVDAKALAQSIELLDTIAGASPLFFLELPGARGFVELALGALGSNDRFVLAQGAKFWGTIVSEEKYTALVHEVGLDLMNRLALQISGEAERSEVSYFSDVLRKLTAKHPKFTGGLLKKAFVEDPQSRNLKRQDEKARSTFVSQLQLLRGSSQTRGVVSKFWMFCRGLPEY